MGGRLGLWAEGIRRIIEKVASRRGWGRNVGRDEIVAGGTWGLGMKGRVVGLRASLT